MSTYEERGVSSDKTDVKRAIEGTYKGLLPNAFCRVIPDLFCGSQEHYLLFHADGAGTKSSLAYLHYQKHGNPDIFHGIAQDSLVMNLDDLLCVGATGPFALSNTIGRNAKLVSGEVIAAIIAGYEKLIKKLKEYNISITNCGGETADVGDLVRTVIVDSALTCRIHQKDLIDCSQVRVNQDIVGLSSFGQAIYEDRYNSGISANGLTAVRHELLSQKYREEYPETFAPEIAKLAYTGKFDIDDPLDGTNLTIGEALLSPTRTYAPIVAKILPQYRSQISAIFHNTGGGQTKCLNFGNNISYVKNNLFPLPPIFKLIEEKTNLVGREMYKTLNVGHRLEIVCEPEVSQEIIKTSKYFGVEARIIGHTEFREGETAVIIDSSTGTIEYKKRGSLTHFFT